MEHREMKAMMDEMSVVVRGFVSECLQPIVTRLVALEARHLERGEPGIPGPPGVDGQAGQRGEPGPQGERGTQGEPGLSGDPGRDGKDADPEHVAALVSEAVAKAVAAVEVPKGERGEKGDAGGKGDPGERGATGETGPQGADGVGIDPDSIAKTVTAEVERHMTSLVIAKGEKGDPGRDGIGMSGAFIEREGGLVLTLADGTTKSVGAVVGKDGAPGINGADGLPGKDGLGFEDMTEELAEDGRTIIRRYSRGDDVKEFRHTFAVLLDRGVYKEGTAYQRGDGVTWGGSFWIAREDTSDKPDTSGAWRLSVKKGRDGKDGKAS